MNQKRRSEIASIAAKDAGLSSERFLFCLPSACLAGRVRRHSAVPGIVRLIPPGVTLQVHQLNVRGGLIVKSEDATIDAIIVDQYELMSPDLLRYGWWSCAWTTAGAKRLEARPPMYPAAMASRTVVLVLMDSLCVLELQSSRDRSLVSACRKITNPGCRAHPRPLLTAR